MSDGDKLFGLEWNWDDENWSSILPVGIQVARWRRGPFTLYRYNLVLPKSRSHYSQWVVKLPFDMSFGIHLPSRLGIAHNEVTCPICTGAADVPKPCVADLEGALHRVREEVLAQPGTGEGPAWPAVVSKIIDEVIPRDPGDERHAVSDLRCVTCGLSKQTRKV